MTLDVQSLHETINLQISELTLQDQTIHNLAKQLQTSKCKCTLAHEGLVELNTEMSKEGKVAFFPSVTAIQQHVLEALTHMELGPDLLPDTTCLELDPKHLYELTTHKDRLAQQLATLQHDCAQLEHARTEHAAVEAITASLRAECAELQAQKQSFQDMQGQAQKLRDEVQDLEALHHTHAGLTAGVAALRTEHAELTHQVKALREEHAQLGPLQDQLAKLEAEAARLRALQKDATHLEAEHARLQTLVAEHRRVLGASQPAVDACFACIDDMEMGMATLTAQHAGLRLEQRGLCRVRWEVWAQRLLLYKANTLWMQAQARLAKIPYMFAKHRKMCMVLDKELMDKVGRVDAMQGMKKIFFGKLRRRAVRLRGSGTQAVGVESVLPACRAPEMCAKLRVPRTYAQKRQAQMAAMCVQSQVHVQNIESVVGEAEQRLRVALEMCAVD